MRYCCKYSLKNCQPIVFIVVKVCVDFYEFMTAGSVSVIGASTRGGNGDEQIQSRRESEQRRAASIDSGSINAYANHNASANASVTGMSGSISPGHTPNCPPGAIDIELEVGDHEVDTMFRDPGPKPIIVARSTPPLQARITLLLWM